MGDPVTEAAISLITALVGGGIYGGVGWFYAKRQGEASSLKKIFITLLSAIVIVLLTKYMAFTNFDQAGQFFEGLGGAAAVSKAWSWLAFELGYKDETPAPTPPPPPPPA